MNLKPVNFDDSELKEDLARLQTFCEHSGEEGWELFDESDIGLTTDFFKRYNRSFSFCLLQKLKYLFSQTELDFKPFVSNLKEFRLRHIYELYFFEKPMDVYISPIDTFNLVWENYGSVTDFEFEIHGPMKVDLKSQLNLWN